MFKYINPGDYRLLNNHNGTTYANNYDAEKVPNSKIGYTCSAEDDYPIVVEAGTKDLWFKLDTYVADDCTIVIDGGDMRSTVSLLSDRVRVSVPYLTDGEGSNQIKDVEAEADLNGKASTFIIHVKTSNFTNNDGIYDVYVNNVKKIHISGLAIMNGGDICIRTINSSTRESVFSNIIVSDSKVRGLENVITLPIKTTEAADWTEETTEDGRNYTTEQLYATISQTIDVDALKTTLGIDAINDINITGITLQVDEMSTNDPNEINAVGKYVLLDNVEYAIGSGMLDDGRSITTAVTKNPANNADWTFEDLENLKLVLKTEKIGE